MQKTKLYEVSLETKEQGLVFCVPVEATSAKAAKEEIVRQQFGYSSEAFEKCLNAKKVETFEEE